MREHGAHEHGGRREFRFRDLLPLEKALALALEAARPVEGTERVPLVEAAGRILAQDVTSPVDVPAFDKAMMDGYALRSRDAASQGASLRVVGVARPGEPFQGTVGSGEAVQTATGAPVPVGCDAVVEVEETEVREGEVRVLTAVAPGRNVSPRGDDVAAGDPLLPDDTRLRAGHLGALAAVGVSEASVYVRPRVAIFATGREVRRGGPLRPGEVHDVNSFTLAALVREHGGDPVLFDPIPDTYEAIRGAVARSGEFDLVVLSASTSVGERDYLRDAAKELGEVLFHGVAVKPGMPLLLARVQGGLVFGMPGFPTSCFLTAYHVLLPVLWRSARQPPLLDRREVVLGEDLPARKDKAQIVPLRIEGGKAYSAFHGSGNITSVSAAEGYTLVPPGRARGKGERAEVFLF